MTEPRKEYDCVFVGCILVLLDDVLLAFNLCDTVWSQAYNHEYAYFLDNAT